MKKIIFFIVFWTTLVSNAQIIDIPDPQFKAALLRSSSLQAIAKDSEGNFIAIDENGDQEIDRAEALRVYELYLQNSESFPAINIITDATGILFFSNLTHLSLGLNDLTSLDVSTISNLLYLSCNDNPRLTTVNVVGLSKLNSLNLRFCNLETINTSGLVNLKNLRVDHNNLRSLDITDCVNINFLFCNDNFLEEFTFSENCLLAVLHCFGNRLTNLNLYGLPNFNQLVCMNNLLTSINIKNTRINTTNGIIMNDNPTLQYICTNTSIVEALQQKVNDYGYTSCVVDDSCDLAVEDFSSAKFTLFPNPTNATLNIVSDGNATLQSVAIYNMLGQQLYFKQQTNLTTIDVSGFAKGTYLVAIHSDKGMMQSKFSKISGTQPTTSKKIVFIIFDTAFYRLYQKIINQNLVTEVVTKIKK